MDQKENIIKVPVNIIAGVCALVSCFINFISFTLSRFSSPSVLISLVSFGFSICFGVMLLMKKHDKFLLIPIAGISVVSVFLFLYNFVQMLIYIRYYNVFTFLSAFIRQIPVMPFLLLFAVPHLTDFAPKYKELTKKYWFVPCIIFLAFLFLDTVLSGVSLTSVLYFFLNLLSTASLILAAMWIILYDRFPHESGSPVSGTGSSGISELTQTQMIAHVLLLLFTCGIYNYIWIYRMTRYLNRVEDEPQRDPTMKLLLCIFVPFYTIYWTYKSAMLLDKLSRTKNISSDLATPCLILAIFVSFVPPILMHEKVLKLASLEASGLFGTSTAAASAPAVPVAPPVPAAPESSTAADLKAYKELLDSGAITQDEYDAKKKQLLGL